MKKYVILGYIYGIGGFQTYMNNKLQLMEDNGWKPYAISNGYRVMPGEMLQGLKKFHSNRMYAFSFPYPNELTKKELQKTAERIGQIIEYEAEDEVIFEAAILDLFMWAEFLAKQFNGRSVCVETSNHFKKYCSTTLDFFHFKEQRGELMMMSQTGLYELFDGYIEYPRIDTNTVGALTQNEFADDGKDYETLLNAADYDYVIGTLGWLNKGYYTVLIDEVIEFCRQNPNKKVQFVVIGKSTTGEVEKEYVQKAQTINNIKLSMMGSIAPVPSNLVRLFDVAVASYGCAFITDKLGVKTILMHDPEFIPLGILGYTKVCGPYIDRVNFDQTISQMITDILINNICDQYEHVRYPISDVADQKVKHLKRIEELSDKIVYYDVESMPNEDVSTKHKLKVLFQRLFGIKATERLLSYLKL